MSEVKTKRDAKGDPTEPVSKELVKVDQQFFDSTGDLAKADGSTQKTPWIGFYGTKTKGEMLDSLKAAGVELNQFYLYDAAGPLKVKPFQYHFLKASRYYTEQDSDGNVIAVQKENPWRPGQKSDFKEHLIALVLVSSKDTMGNLVLTPATWSARSGLVKALTKAIDLTLPKGAAFDAKAWAARGEKNAISANAKYPGGRFVVTAWGSAEDTDDKKNKFNLGHSLINATSPEGVAAFNKIMSDGFVSQIAPATQSWAYRCSQLDKKIKA